MPLINSNTNTIPSHKDVKGSGSGPGPGPSGPQTYQVTIENLTAAPLVLVGGIQLNSGGLFDIATPATTINPPNNLGVISTGTTNIVNIDLGGLSFPVNQGFTEAVITCDTTAPMVAAGSASPMALVTGLAPFPAITAISVFVDGVAIETVPSPQLNINYITLP